MFGDWIILNSIYVLNLKHTTQLRILLVQGAKYTQSLVHSITVPRNIVKVKRMDDVVSHFFEGEVDDGDIKTLDTRLFFTWPLANRVHPYVRSWLDGTQSWLGPLCPPVG